MGAQVYQKTIQELINAHSLADDVKQTRVCGITLDSRKVKAGFLFIAVKGTLADGRQYISQAIDLGAVCILSESDYFGCRMLNNVPVIDIPNLQEKVSEVAAKFYGWPGRRLKIVGVTGTNGKSSCATLLSELINCFGEKAAFIGTLGYGICGEELKDTGHTTPDPVACQRILAEFLEKGVRFVALEASSHAIAQGRLIAIEFDGLIFTNLTRDHLDYHSDLEEYEKAKLALFIQNKPQFVISNGDDATGRKVLEISREKGIDTTAYGRKNGDVLPLSASLSKTGIEALLKTPWGTGKFKSALVGEFNVYNLMAVIVAAVKCGYSFKDVLSNVEALKTVRGRMQRIVIPGEQDISVLLDYAHTPDALEKSLKSLPVKDQEKLWVIFGCGGDRDTGKRPLMGSIAVALSDKVIITSDNPRSENPQQIIRDIVNGIDPTKQHEVVVIEDRESAIKHAIETMAADDTLLIAGKGHEDYQVIGNKKLHFDDAEIAAQYLARRCVHSEEVAPQ